MSLLSVQILALSLWKYLGILWTKRSDSLNFSSTLIFRPKTTHCGYISFNKFQSLVIPRTILLTRWTVTCTSSQQTTWTGGLGSWTWLGANKKTGMVWLLRVADHALFLHLSPVPPQLLASTSSFCVKWKIVLASFQFIRFIARDLNPCPNQRKPIESVSGWQIHTSVKLVEGLTA